MWLRRTINIDLYQLASLKLIPKSNKYLQTSKYCLSKYYCQRCLSTTRSVLQDKYGYMYDDKSDSFRPKSQSDRYKSNHNDSNPGDRTEDDKKGNFVAYMKRFTRNLFLITGGVIWCGVILVTLFVDIKETSEFALQLKDSEEEVRLFAFYDIAQSKTDLANILSKEKQYDADEVDVVTRMKEFALYNALTIIKNQDVIVETLGKPVQLTGYRAAAKLDRMIHNFQNLTQFGLEKITSDDTAKHKWSAECLIEGPKGLAALILEFERPLDKNEWVLSKVVVDNLEKSGNHLLDLAGTLPDGVNFSE